MDEFAQGFMTQGGCMLGLKQCQMDLCMVWYIQGGSM